MTKVYRAPPGLALSTEAQGLGTKRLAFIVPQFDFPRGCLRIQWNRAKLGYLTDYPRGYLQITELKLGVL